MPPAVRLLIEAAGGVPDGIGSELEQRRFRHQDLDDLHTDELDAERIMCGLVKAALLRDRYIHADAELRWFSERLRAVVGEITRRQRARR